LSKSAVAVVIYVTALFVALSCSPKTDSSLVCYPVNHEIFLHPLERDIEFKDVMSTHLICVPKDNRKMMPNSKRLEVDEFFQEISNKGCTIQN
jgi:hypothetical protein